MRFPTTIRKKSCLLGIILLAIAGCTTGPMAEYYAYNPFLRQGPEENEYGPAPARKYEELIALRKNAAKLSAEDRQRKAAELVARVPNESDPVLRAAVVLTLGELKAADGAEALKMAIKDNESRVRVAACQAWQKQGGPEAIAVLSEVLASDTDDDVRLAATRALGTFQGRDAARGLAVALDDANPALQFRAMEALKTCTGEDYGHDVVAWRTFVEGGASPTGPRRGPTLVERMTDWF